MMATAITAITIITIMTIPKNSHHKNVNTNANYLLFSNFISWSSVTSNNIHNCQTRIRCSLLIQNFRHSWTLSYQSYYHYRKNKHMRTTPCPMTLLTRPLRRYKSSKHRHRFYRLEIISVLFVLVFRQCIFRSYE